MKNLEKEEWKKCPIEGYEDYQISNFGRVKSFKINKKEGRFLSLKNTSSKDIHQKVKLSANGVSKTFFVHRLVMITFCPRDDCEKLQVNHIDGNPLNNCLNNLEWVTSKENHEHYKNILIPKRKEESGGKLKLGRKANIIEVTFNSGEKNYYNGIEQAAKELNISKTTINRWLKNFDKESIIDNRIIDFKVVKEAPENHQNIKFITKSQVNQVCIEYWKKPAEYYENCKEADIYLKLPIGTIQRWAKRDWNRINNGKATKMGIKRIFYITNE